LNALTSPIVYDNLDDGTYRFTVFATNNVGNSDPSAVSNTVTVKKYVMNLLPLWIVLGILGFLFILVGFYFFWRYLIARKNRRNDKLGRQTNGENELVIVKEAGQDLDVDKGNTTGGTDESIPVKPASGANSLEGITAADDESNWVSHT